MIMQVFNMDLTTFNREKPSVAFLLSSLAFCTAVLWTHISFRPTCDVLGVRKALVATGTPGMSAFKIH